MKFLFIWLIVFGTWTTELVAQGTNTKKKPGSSPAREPVITDSTSINFEDTLIEGGVKAPNGFFLQGRNQQSMTQMVKLRSNFRNQMKNASAAVNAIVK